MSIKPSFSEFFKALWGYDPFPWQAMLADRVAAEAGYWPRVLDLPTAAGKTACMDIALYALAAQAEKPVSERTASRRIWFVVDRRIVVDEAFDRATRISECLNNGPAGALKQVADRLKEVAGTKRALAVARLRGGIFRDDGWARLPSQPAIITSTVDQLGSRLLFRGYGRSNLTASIFAGLAANDSLIILDEAHCSVPFLQTLDKISIYRSKSWAELPLEMPFAFSFLSATPPQDAAAEVFPGPEREAALDHEILRQRLNVSKLARLSIAKGERGKQGDPLVLRSAQIVESYIEDGKKRIAVIVNRVRTAGEICRKLTARLDDKADVRLLTGRIRPFDRDELLKTLTPKLKAAPPREEVAKPLVLVSTQCIEVGADFSFDALVTECATLDALRQRFGRLDRMGEFGPSPATILIRESQIKETDDPIYGIALSNTWKLLNRMAARSGLETVDFGFAAFDSSLATEELAEEQLEPEECIYLAPRSDAPALLPAHLDLLCQTSPGPRPEPDIQLYLHGKVRSAPEAQVVWRADLLTTDTDNWADIISLCPPLSAEMLSVQLNRLRGWLSGSGSSKEEDSDLQGVDIAREEQEEGDIPRPFLIWRGRDKSRKVDLDPREIRPNDIVVVPTSYGTGDFGQPILGAGLGDSGLDLWERARETAGKGAALRLNSEILKPWSVSPPIRNLLAAIKDDEFERSDLEQLISDVLSYISEPTGDNSDIPAWLEALLKRLRNPARVLAHPAGGIIIMDKRKETPPFEIDLFADDDDLTSTWVPAGKDKITLERHSQSVRAAGKILANRCLPSEFSDALQSAAYWHDVGKLDERFQIVLHNGDEAAAVAASIDRRPLAKSASIPLPSRRRKSIWRASGLPEGFRHEMLSFHLAQCSAPLPEDAASLILHLIASHHGHARPFAPIVLDMDPPPVQGSLGEFALHLSGESRRNHIPAHHLDSGISDRFWQLTRRYGWWGLAYLEAVLRLSDWYGSEKLLTEDDKVNE